MSVEVVRGWGGEGFGFRVERDWLRRYRWDWVKAPLHITYFPTSPLADLLPSTNYRPTCFARLHRLECSSRRRLAAFNDGGVGVRQTSRIYLRCKQLGARRRSLSVNVEALLLEPHCQLWIAVRLRAERVNISKILAGSMLLLVSKPEIHVYSTPLSHLEQILE